MKTKDMLTITTVALGTTTLTVAAFWAGPIEAGADADTPPPPPAGPSRRANSQSLNSQR